MKWNPRAYAAFASELPDRVPALTDRTTDRRFLWGRAQRVFARKSARARRAADRGTRNPAFRLLSLEILRSARAAIRWTCSRYRRFLANFASRKDWRPR